MAAVGGNSVRAGPGCLKSIQPTSKTARAATMIILRLITARFGPGWCGSVTDERLRFNRRFLKTSRWAGVVRLQHELGVESVAASLILTAGATLAYYRLLRLELAARPARCNPVNTSGAKLSRWLLAILMLGAHSQQTAFAQSVPSVTQQPQSQNLLAGTDATFTVSAT